MNLRPLDSPLLQALTRNESTRLMALGVLVGTLGALGACAFDQVTTTVGGLILGTAEPGVSPPAVWLRLVVPAVGGLLTGLLVWGLAGGDRRPAGIPDVVDAVANHEGHMNLRRSTVSALSAALGIGLGLSGGREGPIVQLSAAFGSSVCRRLHLSPTQTRVLAAAAVAGGIAASFNTPLGATFFALEIVLGNFAMASFGPVVAAAVAGTAVGQALLGDRIALNLPPFGLVSPVELLIYPVLGVLSGGVALGLKRAVLVGPQVRERLRLPAWAAGGAAGLGVAGLAAGFPQVMGNGYTYMDKMLSEPPVVWFLVALLVAKLVATGLAQLGNTGVGVFAPSLFVGSVTGTLFGTLVHNLLPHMTESPGAYGMVGMGAVAAAVAHAPITMTLMLFEMTRNYAVIAPMVLTLAVAGTVASYLDPESLYVSHLSARGVSLDHHREELVMYHLKVRDVLRATHLQRFPPDTPLSTLTAFFLHERAHAVYLADEDGVFAGVVRVQSLKRYLLDPPDNLTARDLRSAHVRPVHLEQALTGTMSLFVRSDMDELPVVDDLDHLVGVLKERDIVTAYHHEVLRKEALNTRVEHGPADHRHLDVLDLPTGFSFARVVVTGQFVGHTLRDLRLPARFHVNVVAIRHADGATGEVQRLPVDVDRVLVEGDVLVVTGPADDVEDLQWEEGDRAPTEAVPIDVDPEA